MLYASGEGQFWGFSESGRALTLRGTEYDMELVRNTQSELAAYMRENTETHWESISKEFAPAAMRMLYNEHTDMMSELQTKFTFGDPYNGSTPICNLMDCMG